MIEFSSKDYEVLIHIEANSGVTKRFFTLPIRADSELYVSLLRTNLQEHLNHLLSETRREYYDLGWKHAKAKATKLRWFRGNW